MDLLPRNGVVGLDSQRECHQIHLAVSGAVQSTPCTAANRPQADFEGTESQVNVKVTTVVHLNVCHGEYCGVLRACPFRPMFPNLWERRKSRHPFSGVSSPQLHSSLLNMVLASHGPGLPASGATVGLSGGHFELCLIQGGGALLTTP